VVDATRDGDNDGRRRVIRGGGEGVVCVLDVVFTNYEYTTCDGERAREREVKRGDKRREDKTREDKTREDKRIGEKRNEGDDDRERRRKKWFVMLLG
jgi:hypothetical protein